MHNDVVNLNADRKILYVGDDVGVMKSLQELSQTDFQLIVASTADKGIAVFSKNTIQVVIVDQSHDSFNLSFLTSIKTSNPDVIRMIIAENLPPDKLITLINTVQVFRYITLSSTKDELRTFIEEAFEEYRLLFSVKVSDLYVANKKLENKVIAFTNELNSVYHALQNSIEDNKNNLNYLEAIYHSVPGLLYLFDSHGKLVRWNNKFESLLGYTPDELLNIDIVDFFRNDESKIAIRSAMKSVEIEGFAEVEANVNLKDGTYIPMQFTAVPVQIGGIPYFTGIGVDISQLKKIEKKLKSNYALIKIAGETANFGGWSYKLKDNKFKWSESIGKILELPEGTTITLEDAKDFLKPESRNIFSKANDKCLKKGVPFDIELQIITAKKREIWVRITGAAVENRKGQVVMVQGSFQDINESKIINIALNESERKMSTLISSLPGFVYRCANNKDWTMYYLSDVFERVTGYKSLDFINNRKFTFNDIIHPDYQKTLHDSMLLQLKTNQSYESEYKIITSSGEERWVWEQGQEVFDEISNTSHLEGFIYDITASKNAIEALKISEEKFRTLFIEMNEIAVFFNTKTLDDGTSRQYMISDCNEAFLHAFSLKRNDVINKSPLEIIGVGNQTFRDSLTYSVNHKRNNTFTTVFTQIDKQFRVTVVPLHQDNFAIIASDITELARFNDVLMEKNNELENYVYVTSHDLRSPLVNIQGFSSRLKKQTDIIGEIVSSYDLEPEKKAIVKENIEQKIPNTLDYIFNNVKKMELMLNGLLQLSRTGRVTMNIRQVPMRELMVKVIQSVDYQLKELSSEIVLADLPDCYGDENMLNQLFSNLISNAIKYRHPDRDLKMSIDGILRYRKVQFRVKDNGIGIAKMNFDKIWQVFFRVDHKQQPGDGVGLSVVKRIVEKHNGKIWVESTELIGSTFFIELPVKDFSEEIVI